jgi:hypothetical protein
MELQGDRGPLAAELSRRRFLQRAGVLGVGALVLQALPLAEQLIAAGEAQAESLLPDATMQAFADTILPGRKVARTDLGNEVHPLAIAGVDDRPGAVEADALALFHHPLTGFDTLEPVLLAELELRSLPLGADFLYLSFEKRVEVCKAGLAFGSPTRIVWEAAAAVPFTAFCAAALIPEQTAAKASGYRVMGLPGAEPVGYRGFSYRGKLSRERTKKGYLR